MEAGVGIGRLDRRFGVRIAHLSRLLKPNRSRLAPTSADWFADVLADSAQCRVVAVGAQSFDITPIALNGARKTDKLDARALCLRLARWLDGNRDELAPIRIPSEAEQLRREVTRRRQFLAREVRCLANRGHG